MIRYALFCCALMAAACGKEEPPAAQAPAAEEDQAPAEPAAAPAAHAHAHDSPAEPAAAAMPEAPSGAKVSFVEPTEGATVKGPLVDGKVNVKVRMAAEGIAVKPAGAVEAGSGHHHVLIDTVPTPAGTVVPADDTHIHFGKAQTEAEIPLSPGAHSLTLQFADGIHRSYGPALSATIKLTVEGEGAPAETAQ